MKSNLTAKNLKAFVQYCLYNLKFSSITYLQSNGQAKLINMIIIQALKKILDDYYTGFKEDFR